jgi:hypothetical protein
VNIPDDASYDCPACGEEIDLDVDLSAGSEQEFVTDCPVCCRPIVVRVEVDPEGFVTVSTSTE